MDPQMLRLTEHRFAIITEVDPTIPVVNARDQHGQLIAISFNTHGPTTAVPTAGEVWMVRQINHHWYLVSKMDDGSETTPVSDLQPGDKRVEASTDLHLNGQHVYMNGQDIPATIDSLNATIASLTDRITALEAELP